MFSAVQLAAPANADLNDPPASDAADRRVVA